MTFADWIALFGIALPLAAKVAVDVAAYLNARKHNALANIVGMAGRQAATIARTLAALPPNVEPRAAEQALLTTSAASIMTEMGASTTTVGADSAKVATLLQGELDKFIAPNATAVVPLTYATPPAA